MSGDLHAIDPPRRSRRPGPRRPVGLLLRPHGGVPFDGKAGNAVWCATFPLAWHALATEVLGGPVLLGPPAPADLVAGMNARPFPSGSLAPSARVVAAGRIGDGVLDRIRREGREKFRIDLPRTPIGLKGPDDLLAYAFLRKDLPFDHPFETIEGGLRFAGGEQPVAAFGINGDSRAPDLMALREQVTALFHGEAEEEPWMAVEIRTKTVDILTLAMVPPEASLEATWRAVTGRRRTEASRLAPDEMLAVPKLHFDLTHRFREFLEAPFLNEGFAGARIVEAVQSVLFRLDEAGAVLESEAVVAALRGAPARRRRFVFDRPFLVALLSEKVPGTFSLTYDRGMCGRYTLSMTPAAVLEALRASGPPPDQPPRWNVAPTQSVIVAVVTDEGEGRRLRPMRWGLIPRWAKDPAIGNRLINARAETLGEKPSFRDAYRRRRCLIVADGFYEWRKTAAGKQPVWIHPVAGGVLTFAGLWESWTAPDGAVVESCTIVTTAANDLIGTFHHRMPVILPEEARDRWLDPAPREPSDLADLLVPCPSDLLALRPVTTRVNSPARDGPDLLDPAP